MCSKIGASASAASGMSIAYIFSPRVLWELEGGDVTPKDHPHPPTLSGFGGRSLTFAASEGGKEGKA